jgi:serine/threonine protein kinase
MADSVPLIGLAAYLRADAPARERAILGLWIAASLLGLATGVAMILTQKEREILFPLHVLFGSCLVYAVTFRWVIGRGWFHPAIVWANVTIEVTVLGLILAIAAWSGGPLYLLMPSQHFCLGVLVVFTALRAIPWLPLWSGVLAAGQFLAIYFFFLRSMPPESPLYFPPAPALARAAFMVLGGGAGTVLARYLISKAEAALRASREQDLMGKYFLHERLGSGGMAEVFRATYWPEGGFRKTVAVKRVLPGRADTERFTRMFLEEARLCAMLTHPNVVQVLDCGKFQDRFILAMEYVEGCSLARLLKGLGRPLPLAAVTFLGAELAAALDYIHKRVGPDGMPLGLVHRDLNPPNVLLSRIGEVKLADFGVAHVLSSGRTHDEYRVYGKVRYMAPEQLRGQPFDGRADLFCLGLTLHEALTGTSAIRGDTQQVFEKTGRLVEHPPSLLRPEVPPELDALVMRLLAESPEQRPATGEEVREALTALHGEAAPYPHGLRLLAEAVRAVASSSTSEGLGPPAPGTTPLPLPPSEESPSLADPTTIRLPARPDPG